MLSEIDKEINNDPDWPNVCMAESDTNTTCLGFDPVTRKQSKGSFLALLNPLYGTDHSEITQYAIDFALFIPARVQFVLELTQQLFSKEFVKDDRKAKMTRMIIRLAGPLEVNGIRYANMKDRIEEQNLFVNEWVQSLNSRVQKIQKARYPDVRVNVIQHSWLLYEFVLQVVEDMQHLGIAFLVLLAVLSVKMRSLFLVVVTVLMMVFSIPVTLVLSRHILEVENINLYHLNLLFIFMCLVFEYFTTIKATFDHAKTLFDDPEERMAYTVRKSFRDLLAAALPCSLAFLGSLKLPLMNFMAFGIFSSILIAVLYLKACFAFTSFVVFHD